MHAHIRLRKYLISGGASKPYCSQYKWQFQAEWLNGFVSGWITGKIISPSRRRKSLKWRIYSWRLTVISVLTVYCRGIREWDICWVRLKMPLYLLQLLSFHRNSLGEIVEVRFQWLWHDNPAPRNNGARTRDGKVPKIMLLLLLLAGVYVPPSTEHINWTELESDSCERCVCIMRCAASNMLMVNHHHYLSDEI